MLSRVLVISCIYIALYHSFSYGEQEVYLWFHIQPKTTDCYLEDVLHLTIEKGADYHRLHLTRNDDIDVNLPVYSLSIEDDGTTKFKRQFLEFKHDIAVYHEIQAGVSVMIQCVNEVSDTDRYFLLDGHVYINGTNYKVEPVLEHGTIKTHPDNSTKHLYTISPQTGDHSCQLQQHTVKHQHFNSVNREKRSSTSFDPVIIDIAIYVDTLAYNTWRSSSTSDLLAVTDLKRYFTHVISGINLRFQSMKPELDITIRPVSITIDKEVSPWTNGIQEVKDGKLQVDASKSLNVLSKWLMNNSVSNYDHVMLFTGHNLYSDGNEVYTTGLATIGTMCNSDGSSVSIVEDTRGFQSIITATHELGHGMNSKHDSDGNVCKAEDRFIMASKSSDESPANILNPWKFSACSIDYFKKFLTQRMGRDEPTKICLTTPREASDIPDITQQLAGQVYGPDEQCRHIYSEMSYVCRDNQADNAESACRKMYCHIPDTRKCSSLVPATGTSCGNKKWCLQAECIHNDMAPAREANCVYGDQDSVVLNDITCQHVNDVFNGYCYIKTYQDSCCETCAKVKTQNTVCPYGDKDGECSASNCGKCTNAVPSELYDIRCCGTCKYTGTTNTQCPPPDTTTSVITERTTEIPPCTDLALINSVTCSEYIKTNGKLQCYAANVEKICNATCSCLKGNIVGCQYGDQIENCVSSSCDAAITNGKYSDICCETCSFVTTLTMTPTTAIVTPSTAAPTSTSCIDLSSFRGSSCPDYINQNGKAKCYDLLTRSSCCLTCHNYKNTNNPGCEYGDRQASCSQINFTNDTTCGETSLEQCCESCSKLKPTPSPDCLDGSGIRGVPCSSYIKNYGKIECYKTSVLTACCRTCYSYSEPQKTGCEYGDKAAVCASMNLANYKTCSEKTKRYCCDKCLQLKVLRNTIGNASSTGAKHSCAILSLICFMLALRNII